MTSGGGPLPPGAAEVERRRLRLALALWAGSLVALWALTLPQGPERQSVLRHYRGASAAWVEGRPLYGDGREHGFLYLPTFAVLHEPFAALPFRLGGAAWRALNLLLLGYGLLRLSRVLGGARAGSFLLLASLVSLGWSAARHGQSTLGMAGALLAASAALAEGGGRGACGWRAAGWCAGAVVLKPLALAYVLLAAVAWRGLAARLLPALLAVAALPFLAQRPGYVAEQWTAFGRTLAAADAPLDQGRFIDLLGALGGAGLPLPPPVALGVRALAGLGALVVLLALRRRASPAWGAASAYAVAALYLLAFNPRTEHNTYALLAPVLGLGLAGSALAGRRRQAAAFALLALWLWLDHALASALSGSAGPWSKLLLLAATAGVLAASARRAERAPAAGGG